jgi:hypothetical protein
MECGPTVLYVPYSFGIGSGNRIQFLIGPMRGEPRVRLTLRRDAADFWRWTAKGSFLSVSGINVTKFMQVVLSGVLRKSAAWGSPLKVRTPRVLRRVHSPYLCPTKSGLNIFVLKQGLHSKISFHLCLNVFDECSRASCRSLPRGALPSR